jgi:hypothetical protein
MTTNVINIDPTLWGPHGWRFMHYITMSYPKSPSEVDKNNMRNFFMSVKNVLPCETCRSHFSDQLQKNPLNNHALSSNDNLVKWLTDIHNDVNKLLGKKIVKYSDLKYLYFGEINWKLWIIIGIIILIIVLLILIRFI